MSELDDQKNHDLELAKLKLTDMKQIILETQRKIHQLQDELEIGVSQHHKKIKSLKNIYATQSLKLTRLDGDIKNSENLLNSRLLELKTLEGVNAEEEAMLAVTREETGTVIEESRIRCEELEEAVKRAYVHIQTEKDMEMLYEVGVNILKDPAKLPLVLDELVKRKEIITQRREDQSKELSQIDRMQNNVTSEIAKKQKELAALKQKNAELSNYYIRATKIKKGF